MLRQFNMTVLILSLFFIISYIIYQTIKELNSNPLVISMDEMEREL